MRAALIFIAMILGLVGPVQADDHPVVVELFTSQGCSSCPPADALLHELAERDDIIALALHVDYWDYIGWKDIFASSQHTQRQYGYAHAGARRMVYTPQMIIGGQDQVVGTHPQDIETLLKAHKNRQAAIRVDIARDGTTLVIQAESQLDEETPLIVQVVEYRPRASVDVTRGENAGQTLHYANIVTRWAQVARWDGTGSLNHNATLLSDGPVAVIIQDDGFGPIRAAAQLR